MDCSPKNLLELDCSLRFIGVVRSEIQDRKLMPAFGVPARVEIFPEFAGGLLHLDKHSHFWVLAWLTVKPERDLLQVTPRGAAEGDLHGVFAVRSPARPNPIGLTAARLLRREGLALYFDRLDFLDGTPVVDLKPYFVTRDLIRCANNAVIGRPRDEAALLESLRHQAALALPENHADVDLAVQIVYRYRVVHSNLGEPAEWNVVAPSDRPYLIDALLALTHTRFSRGFSLWAEAAVCLNGERFALPHGPRSFSVGVDDGRA
ncbi:MAG: tRNA (N6-threonylcarbamoyladenosine(37)-N6)-methyltransferase TrmO [Bryobacteraceae bacterium]|nr:tRNA (N6-threonylcarbamoyladenosine(37)-N6)-methyltransferase TrmO [Bryobacteraceae bacterium]MDW8378005.1 tRNA (N6-threonylcarbamoyladenosine(37)-N6)-methyltransferase TrmO [Bryobacterales bacterium]